MFVKLTEDVRSYGGEVLIFSSMHESGQRASSSKSVCLSELIEMARRRTELNQLTGIAAILTYPLDIEVVEEEERVEAEERKMKEDGNEEEDR